VFRCAGKTDEVAVQNCTRKPQTCNSSSEVENSSDHLTADASDELHASEDCQQSCVTSDMSAAHVAAAGVENHQRSSTYEVGSEMFRNSCDSKKHLYRQANRRPFHCKVCGKCVQWKSVLLVHMRSHAGERPFNCKVCKSKFTRASHLKQHMRIHTGERKFVKIAT